MLRCLATVAVVALVAVGCGQDTTATAPTPAPAATTAAPTTAPPAPTPTPPTLAPVSCDIRVSADTAHKPTVTFPKTCPAPTALQGRDIVAGTGAPVQFGQTPVVQYVGISLSNHKQFDASWDRNDPLSVPNIGQGSVIEGWNQGLLGMRKGGRRLLVIPPNLAYGANGQGAIGPNETLVFVIDVLAINP